MAVRLDGSRLTPRSAFRGALGLVAALVSFGAVQRSPGDGGVALRAVRSYRAERGTQIDAFLQVPYGWLVPTKEGGSGVLSYTVTVRVEDTSTDSTLLRESWKNHAPAGFRRPDAFGVEVIHFSVAPGRYRLAVEVQDSVSGQKASSAIDLEGFSSAPSASDLLLSPQIRLATPGDSVPRAAEIRWGQMVVTAAAQLELTPLRAHAFYLLEAYSPDSVAGTLEMLVSDSLGKAIVRTARNPVQIAAGGGVLHGQVDLTGLPPGLYSMSAILQLGKDTIERSASFVMRGVAETLEKEVARRQAERVTDEGYFTQMSDDSLAAAQAPLEVIAESQELASWDKSLSPRAKRNFLTRFWAARDPTPGTERNEAREAFYQKVQLANREYREAGNGSPAGWRTDRGRIYLRNGAPDEVKQQGAHGEGGRLQSRALAWEVWHYTGSGKDRYYIFVDRTGLGAFALVRSNDIRENSLSNWNEFFGRDDLEEIGRFLGRDVFR